MKTEKSVKHGGVVTMILIVILIADLRAGDERKGWTEAKAK